MKKHIISIVLICVIALFSGCGKPENAVTPPFFKVTDAETGGEVYMLGTMHVGLDNTAYPEEVFAALDECGALAVELDLFALETNISELSAAMRIMELDGMTAEEYMGEDCKEIRDFLQNKGIYSANLERYIPAVWSSMLSTKLAEDCGYSSDFGTDRALLTYAKKNGKPIFELESAAEQYQINANEGRELQIYMLLESVRADYELQKRQMNELYSAWASGDVAALESMLDGDEPPEELAEQYEQFYFEMYENRQRKMADYILGVLESGETAFVAVGAMHFAAAPDIIDCLEEAGYAVERISL
ncbi:MAG: TraB/GumN family protein [Lachnospiraceae bacterium]|nr:TraB/GumN family protein [Ruminococcus sp.]MCM1275227.1 TraB/GumN family protein [Lachnospiraceae bacterium]